MSPRHVALRAGLALLVLLSGACSVNPYRTAEPLEPSVPASPDPTDTVVALPRAGAVSSSPQLPGAAPMVLHGNPILERVATRAQQMIGVPYQYGGHSPRGFDCSGLVFYAYREAGLVVPRTSREQLRASRPLDLAEALPGDLLFFNTREKASHVGIYLGAQRFVHAPSTGKAVEIQRLDHDYYRRHLIRIGRLDVSY